MVTATKLPFSLSVIRTFAYEPGGQAVTAEKEATKFVLLPGANSLTGAATVFIRENEGVELVFESADAGARLYLPCLDVAEDAGRVLHDDAGDYIAPSAERFRLCGAGKEGLLVERMAFFVLAEGTRYYGSFEVAPRQLDHSEWKIMQQELEAEFEGLSRSWKKGQAGRGIGGEQALPLRAFRDLERLETEESKLFAALLEIREQPRYEIKTVYEKEPIEAGGRLDEKSLRADLARGGVSHVQQIPKKRLDYDIPENRMLRIMADAFAAKLTEFSRYTEDPQLSGGRMYAFTKTVRRYRHMLEELRSSHWYQTVSMTELYTVPQGILADSRYYMVYRLHLALKRDHLGVTMQELYRLSYQKSSLLYELWCYFKLQHVLEEFATETIREESYAVGEGGGLSLRDGSRVGFENDTARFTLVYNQTLEQRNRDTERDPLYFATSHNGRNHNHPDLLLHIFSKKTGWYVGSIILECKYRKVRQIWAGERSSLGQLETYYKNACSDEIYGGIGKLLRTNPVCGVMALTPDTSTAPIRSDHFPLETFALRPGKENRTRHALSAHIRELIEKALKAEEVFSR
mgnify:FL=1